MANIKNANHFEKIRVISTSFDVFSKWNFNSLSFCILIESFDETDTIEYSLDGIDVHGEINPKFFKGVFFDNRTCSIVWFRRKGTGSCVVVRIEAWR